MSAPSAFAVTAAPTLIEPAAGSTAGGQLKVRYALPETALAQSVTIIFEPDFVGTATTVTLAVPEGSQGEHSFTLATQDLTASSAVVGASPTTSLADGEYTVRLRYQNEVGDPVAFTAAEDVTLRATTGAPTLSEPADGSS
ncbi:MAG TPA: hypothetical protein VH025_08990, partial [Solirubrobacteraceae bacterium]|nr:hypothetical protein [Solirubrobacteraceae bacterium]